MARSYKKRGRAVGRPLQHDPRGICRLVDRVGRELKLSINQTCAILHVGEVRQSGNQWVSTIVTGPTLRRLYTRYRALFGETEIFLP